MQMNQREVIELGEELYTYFLTVTSEDYTPPADWIDEAIFPHVLRYSCTKIASDFDEANQVQLYSHYHNLRVLMDKLGLSNLCKNEAGK